MNIQMEKLLFCLADAAVAVLIFRARRRADEPLWGWRSGNEDGNLASVPHFLPGLAAIALVLVLARFLPLGSWPVRRAGELLLAFLHISVYYALLLLLMPLLRRTISAAACAALWLIPTLIGLAITRTLFARSSPLAVIPLPLTYLRPVLVLWGCGFGVSLMWQVLSHMELRRRFRLAGKKVEDGALLARWQEECRRHRVEREIPVLVVPQAGTPLTIGCFEQTMLLILPRTDYTPEEQRLIFRHELRHIVRCDSLAKVFLGLCAALYWFNPLGWMACRKAAEDLELSCDEAVLEGEDEAARREYARLLLRSAGTGRGCTTCLSAAASTLRYRLRRVVRPEKRHPGAPAVGAAAFLLLLSFGTVSLADSPASAREEIFSSIPPQVTLSRMVVESWREGEEAARQVYGYDGEALTRYLSGLTVRRVYAGSTWMGEGPGLELIFEEEAEPGEKTGWARVHLRGRLLEADTAPGGETKVYWVEEGIDWDYLDTLLDLEAPNPDPTYYAPKMSYQLTGEEEMGQWKGGGQMGELWEELSSGSRDASSRVVSIQDAQGRRTMEEVPVGIGGHFGGTYGEARLEFSVPPDGGYTVTVEKWDGSDCYTLSSRELEGDVLPLAPYSAHYTVAASFPVGDALYQMEFYFDLGQDADREVWRGG